MRNPLATQSASSCPPSDSEGTESCPDSLLDALADAGAQLLDTVESLPEALLDLTGVTPHRSFDQLEYQRFCQGLALAAKLRSKGHDGLADKLAYCHNDRTTAVCGGCGKRVAFYNRCDLFWCPQCSPRLSKKRLDDLLWFVDAMKQCKHIVLTLRNVPHLTTKYLRDARDALNRLRRQKFFSGCRSGLWAMEITNHGKGWHVHFHLVCDVPWLPVTELSERWKKATGGAGEIVWIEDAQRGSLKANLPRYVTKYTGKGFKLHEWDADLLSEFVTAIKGVRTFGVFGELLGRRAEWREWVKSSRESRRKCECGCSQWSYYSDSELLWHDHYTGLDRRTVSSTGGHRLSKAQEEWQWTDGRRYHDALFSVSANQTLAA
jgi:hypothetical protein